MRWIILLALVIGPTAFPRNAYATGLDSPPLAFDAAEPTYESDDFYHEPFGEEYAQVGDSDDDYVDPLDPDDLAGNARLSARDNTRR